MQICFYSPVLVELGGEAVEGAVFTAGFFTDDLLKRRRVLLRHIWKSLMLEPDMFCSTGYDAAMILLTALKNANGVGGGEAHQKEMLKIKDFPGITGNTLLP